MPKTNDQKYEELRSVRKGRSLIDHVEDFANRRRGDGHAGDALISFLCGQCVHWRAPGQLTCELCGDDNT